MSGRIAAAGFAAALVMFAWQAGAGVKSLVTAKAATAHHAVSTPLPAAFTLRTAWGNITCTLGHAAYSCTAPKAQPVPPSLYTVAGAR